jgi:hypothetical protein
MATPLMVLYSVLIHMLNADVAGSTLKAYLSDFPNRNLADRKCEIAADI